jgi:hypothetical protein
MNDSYYIFEGMDSIDNRLVGSATTLSSLSHILINDYFGIKLPGANFSASDRLELILSYEFIHRRDRLDGYSICGLTIRECINGAKKSKVISS